MYSNNAATVRRMGFLQRILVQRTFQSIQLNLTRAYAIDGKITIDGVEKDLKAPQNPEFVPRKFVHPRENGDLQLSQTTLHHLRWMLQKDRLGQDMFLLGRPGPLRRSIAMQFLQMTQRELEYVALSRDTTESDLKQRREIIQGTATYFDQSAVRAAIEGRILVIEGVEKAERNVLPVLNNLLENREMHLEDGRFLIPAERYDKLLTQFPKADLDKWGLVRVSEDFRVIALGLPVPKYKGAPLDPPLRSRFQAREITNLSYQELLQEMQSIAPNANVENLKRVASFGFAVLSSDTASSLPDFPLDNLLNIARIMNNNPSMSVYSALYRVYPYKVFLQKDGIELVESLMKSLDINVPSKNYVKPQRISSVSENLNNGVRYVTVENEDGLIKIALQSNSSTALNKMAQEYVETNYQNSILSDLIQSYAAGDFAIVGPKGSGKSLMVAQLANLLNQTIEPMVLYQDMTARDLIQQRTTKLNGDTIWRDSSLVRAARNGHIAVLDGINRIHNSTIAILHRLVHDRELQLYDGKRLIRHDKYDELIAEGATDEMLEAKGLLRIHPSFRVIALAEPPALDTASNWLTPEMLSLFLFHEIRNLSKNEEIHVIEKIYGQVPESMKNIIELAQLLREATDPTIKNLAGTLSTRQLLRIAHRLTEYPMKVESDGVKNILNCPYHTVQSVFLSKFLPSIPKAALENAMSNVGIQPETDLLTRSGNSEVNVAAGKLRIGSTVADIYETNDITKVPDILFYDVPQHINLLEHLLQDFLIGNHLLLVGNQGVGKNKIADKLLQLMNRPREYIQLHRDTTVQTLTLQPTVKDGVVIYEDSPLVKAVKNGHVLVVDEADKAPTHVTCILKTLVENGEMTLSDGRKILPATATKTDLPDIIYTHPDFRMIVLANRPGFPFLGNDFFGVLGDLFGCHAVDNPSVDSETYLLQQYGPDVSKEILRKLVSAFGELREMADVGQLSYPYSTREVVNIVKHLQKYPNENMSELIGNVLDFDRHTAEALEQVTEVLQRHGLGIEAYAKNELAAIRKAKEIQMTIERFSGKDVSSPKHGKIDPENKPHVGGNTWAGGSGGRDTAGLGGKGGPYRLDSGNPVHQLSDEEKDDIPEHVKKAAREMNRKAFEEKLKEIKMSSFDHSIYTQFSGPVKRQVQQLRTILQSLQAKSKERNWQKHQTSGELDDGKLIEGITGEKNIYRRRTEQEPEPGQPQEKPKRLTLVVDVSGSMYRFNGYDGRLDRELEAVVMVMEAFQGFENRVQYDIVGHSGESHCIPFVNHKRPPTDDKLRLETIKMMHAHSQFCWSGDYTLPATSHAIDSLAKEDCDEAIVIVLSDANLSRYGISPKKLGEALKRQEPKVQAYTIFIGSLQDEAEIITKSLPSGRSFICMDLAQLPVILKQIFASSVLQQSAN